MNLNQFLNTLDAHKPAAQPLPPHQAQEDECDDHTRRTYALMLASVLHTRPPVSEAQARVFDLLLGSLGLASIQVQLFAEAQTLEESALLEALRLLSTIGARPLRPLITLQAAHVAHQVRIWHTGDNKENKGV